MKINLNIFLRQKCPDEEILKTEEDGGEERGWRKEGGEEVEEEGEVGEGVASEPSQ